MIAFSLWVILRTLAAVLFGGLAVALWIASVAVSADPYGAGNEIGKAWGCAFFLVGAGLFVASMSVVGLIRFTP